MGNTESVGGKAVVSLSLNELEDRIKRAKITGTLDLSHQGIATFPQEILQLKGKITSLCCNYNSIARIPDGLAASMVTLTRIELQANWLTTLPPDFGQLINLEILDLSYNLLTSLPDSLGEFRRLKELDLGWNKIQYLPASLLPKIASLKKLNLQGNYLTALPQEIGQLSILTSLNLRNNKLQTLPPDIGKLKQLTDINLVENQLTYLPPEFGELEGLLRLLVFDNKLDTLPVEVAKLPALANVDLSNNRLDRLFYPPTQAGNIPEEQPEQKESDSAKKRKKKKDKEEKSVTNAVPDASGEGNKKKKDPTAPSPDPARRKRGETTTLVSSSSGTASDYDCKSPTVPTMTETRTKSAQENGEAEEEEDNLSHQRRLIDLERELDRERAKQQQQQEEEDTDEPVKWKRVQRLHMNNNILTEVPISIAKAMKGLKVLCLQHNSIRHIPRELGLLKYLETVDLSYNQLEDLPVELSQLPLKVLYITNNRLKYTESLERLCGGLLSLQEIHLGGNQLKQAPESLGKLEFLTYINLYQNFISALPDTYEGLPSYCEARPEIGSSSRQIILSYNRFEAFPPQLLKLRCLHELHLSGNAIAEVPEEVKNLSRLMLLSLGNNRVPLKLPDSIGELSSLERLYLRGSPLVNVPVSLRKLVPRLLEIDVNPDVVLPPASDGQGSTAGSEEKLDGTPASAGSGELKVKENGNEERSEAKESPKGSGGGGGEAQADESKVDNEGKSAGDSAQGENGGGQEDDKKTDKQRKKEQKEKEKADKKAKKAQKEKGKGGRFLQRLKGSNTPDDKKGKEASELEKKNSDNIKKPKRPKLPKDWPLFITPYEEGTSCKRFNFGCAKMIGLGRKNEDTLMLKGSLTGKDEDDYFAVFDGHGGKHASRFAADNMHGILSDQLALNPNDPEGALRRAFAEVNQRMLAHFQKGNLREECGCTAIVALISGNMIYVAGAGDSRAVYCYGNTVQRMSVDHKPYLDEETRRVRSVGGLVKVDSDYAKQYRVCKLFAGGGFGGLAVSRALGDFSWTPQVVEEPTIMSIPLPTKPVSGSPAVSPSPKLKSSRGKKTENEDGHAYLILGCDGVWDVLSDEEAAAIAQKEKNPLTAAVRIREHAYYLGSGDDICAVVVRLL